MLSKTVTMVILAACMFTASTQAGVVITHNGSTDPLSEGWTLFPGGTANVASGPINDNGTEAWFVDDDSTAAGGRHYFQFLDSADVTDGINNGWSMDVTVRVADTPDTVDVSVWANVLYDNTYFALVFGS